MSANTRKRTIVFVGTYTGGENESIYVYELDRATGALARLSAAAGIATPSFLAVARGGRFLYAVCAGGQSGGQPGGAVVAFAIDPGTFALTRLNDQPSHGAGPCHLSLDERGRILLVANYSQGSVASYPIRHDGAIGAAGSAIQHKGSSINAERQGGPHAHSITVDPTNRYAFAADLGLDQVLCYKLDPAAGTMTPGENPSTAVTPGAGPRHFAFAPGGRFAYLINELDSTMIAYAYDSAAGALSALQILSTLPAGWTGTNYPADVHVSPDGRFVYGSNRRHDSIVIYAADQARGTLTLVGHEPTGGKEPRGFNLSPRGDFLLAANQNSDTIVPFRIDPQTGKLSATGQITRVPAPVCVQMIEVDA